jgi:hypothetical protein
MEIQTNGDVRRRFDDDDSTQLLASSTSNGTPLAKRLDRRTRSRLDLDDMGDKGNERSLRLRGKSSLRLFSVVQILFLATFAALYFINEDVYSKLSKNKCSLLYGDEILRQVGGYSISHLDGRQLFTRRENKTILYPDSCHVNATVTNVRGQQQIYQCLSQTFLFRDNNPYYALRLFRLYNSFDDDNDKKSAFDDDDILVQGPFSTSCGDWINATDCPNVQLVVRTDLKSGRVTIGYPPIPVRRELLSEDVALYVDGSALLMTSLNRGS